MKFLKKKYKPIEPQLLEDITRYVRDNYAEEIYAVPMAASQPVFAESQPDEYEDNICMSQKIDIRFPIFKEETFSEMLLRLIDEKGMSDPDAYHKAWVDRRVFSKIRSNPDYTPLKKTAVAFALALELGEDAADELLMKAGYALSNGSVWDLIIRYCIENKIYDIYDVNCILNELDAQPLFG